MNIVLSIFFVYGLTLMITQYDGPFQIFMKLRNMPYFKESKLLNCFVCSSVYIAIIPAFLLSPSVSWFCILWFALSGGAIIINKLIEAFEGL